MLLTLVKISLTPLLMAVTTLATRRWGPTVGGWLVGLPLTSGPVSAFLLLEQGADFACSSAHSTLNGLLAVVAFCLVYERTARKHAWPVAILSSLSAYFLVVWIFSLLLLPLWGSAALVFSGVTLAAMILKPVPEALPSLAAPYWDLPLRMLTAAALVITITTASAQLGPQWSGLLSTFPIFICVMSAFSHYLYGTRAIRKFERGVVVGSYAFAVFFLIVVVTVRVWPPAFVYAVATLAALGTNALVYKALSRPQQARERSSA